MIGDLSPPHRIADDAMAWEGVVVDPEGLVEQAICRRSPFEGKSVLEVGHSSITHGLRHSAQALQVYAVKFDDGMCARSSHPVGLPSNLNLLRCDASGLPLRDCIVDLAILRDPFPGSGEEDIEFAIPEAMRVLKVGATAFAVSLNYTEGDLGALLEAMMMPEDAMEVQRSKERRWKSKGFELERVPCYWRAPGRTILRRVLGAEFAGLPHAVLAEHVSVSELSCGFDLFWKSK